MMKDIIGYVFIGGVVLLWLTVSLGMSYTSIRDHRGFSRWAGAAAGLFVATGSLAWFLPVFVQISKGRMISTSTDWPVGYSTEYARTSTGMYAVPHESVGRVQVYDAQKQFLRGWNIDANGGAISVAVTPQDQIEVRTARTRNLLLFAIDGSLVASAPLDPSARLINSHAPLAWFPTWIWEWPFASQGFAFCTLLLGLFILVAGGQLPLNKKRLSWTALRARVLRSPPRSP